MSGRSPIEWTEHTWNPVVGCSLKSPGCTNCYAMAMAARIEAMTRSLQSHGSNQAPHYFGTTKRVNGHSVWTGKLALAPDTILFSPLRRKKPTTYFVNSMGDLFHEDCPEEWIAAVFNVMAETPQHKYQVLTKRAHRMHDLMSGPKHHHLWSRKLWHGSVLPNVWLGVSCERQQEADERIPLLLRTPAALRFISAEPLLGPIDLTSVRDVSNVANSLAVCNLIANNRLDWVIVGGESGSHSRLMQADWARSIIADCRRAGVACFVKQLGSGRGFKDRKGGDPSEWPEDFNIRELPDRSTSAEAA